MFDLGWSEMMLVAAVAVIVVGPKDLPRLMRTIGQFITKAKGMASELQSQFMDIAHQSELDEIRKSVSDISVQNPLEDIEKDLAKATAGEGLNSTIHDLEERDSGTPEAETDPAMVDDEDLEEWDTPSEVKADVSAPAVEGEAASADAAAEDAGAEPQSAETAEPAEPPKEESGP